MSKHLPLTLIAAATVVGCASTSLQGPSTVIHNPRIVERALVQRAAPVVAAPVVVAQVRRPVERSLSGPAAIVTTAPVGQPPAAPPRRWEVRVSDVRLSNTFERWAAEAAAGGHSYKILWDADKHVLIDATPAYGGTILDAVEAALSTPAIRRSAYPLEACLYPNTPPLIRITKRGEQTEACPDIK